MTGATGALESGRDDSYDLAGLIRELERLEITFRDWEEVPRSSVEAYRRSLDAFHGEALRRLIRVLRSEPAALAAIKEALNDNVVYAVLRYHEIVKPSLNERVEAALDSVRPMLKSHDGDVELVKVAPPIVEVRFIGSCDGCAASALTFHAGVKKAVQEACPDITDVVQVKGLGGGETARFLSPFALSATGGWLPAGVLADIPGGAVRAVDLGGQQVLLFRSGTIVSCFRDACAHLGKPIRDGEIENGIIACPHHGFRYALASGECLTAPEVSLQMHAVRIIGERVEVRLAT